jgi:aspartate carbamoyltransferase catalytic subunit
VAICGDILHSRVARSNIWLLNTMGARVRVVAPRTLLPAAIERLGVDVFHDMAKGLAGVDIVMMLRLQSERMHGSFVPSAREYFHFFGLDYDKLRAAKPDALIMHPGPMNRGVEIGSEVADDIDRSLIRAQVEMGVAVRMACLERPRHSAAVQSAQGDKRVRRATSSYEVSGPASYLTMLTSTGWVVTVTERTDWVGTE